MPNDDVPEESESAQDEMSQLFKEFAEASEAKDADAAMLAALRVMESLPEKEAQEPLSLWDIARNQAYECQERCDWEGTERALRNMLEIGRGNLGWEYEAHRKLGALCFLLGREEQGYEQVLAAAVAARATGKWYLTIPAMSGEIRHSLRFEQFDLARTQIGALFEAAKEAPSREMFLTNAFILRARYFSDTHSFDNSQADLEAAWEFIAPWEDAFIFAGWQYNIASWWKQNARLRMLQNDAEGELAARRENVHRHRIIAQIPQLDGPYKHNDLALALHELGRALERFDDDAARYSLQESRSIRRSINLPPLEEM